MNIKLKTREIACKLKHTSTSDGNEKHKIYPWKIWFQGQTDFVE